MLDDDWFRFHPAKEKISEIPAYLQRQTTGHGYHAGCECDLVGGDPDCEIRPPYETIDAYIERLLGIILELNPEYEPDLCLSCGRDLNKSGGSACEQCVPF